MTRQVVSSLESHDAGNGVLRTAYPKDRWGGMSRYAAWQRPYSLMPGTILHFIASVSHTSPSS